MKEPVVFGAIQLSSQADLGLNLARAEELVRAAVSRGAQAVLLPENFAFMGEEEDKRNIAEHLEPNEGGTRASRPTGGGAANPAVEASASTPSAGLTPIGDWLGRVARENRVWLVAGGLPERSADPARPFNTCAVVDPTGTIAAKYRKIHLFDVDLADGSRYRESASTTGGSSPVTASIAGLTVGLSVCYDVRFPELYRLLSAAGAEVLVVPAAFTLATGKDHWLVLLRARAIEAQAWVVAAAQWGKHPRGRQTFGKSCIIDPWGEIVAQASEGEGFITARLDPAYLERVRSNLPALRHRKL
jgi:deaminated glutathione amidase